MFKKIRGILQRLLTTRVAWPIVLTIGLLCAASILALDLSWPDRAARQEIHVAIGAAVMILVLLPHFQNFGRIAYVLYGAMLVLLVAVYGTTPVHGATRWFQVTSSIQVQPSEIAKIAFVLTIAWYLRYRRDVSTIGGLIIPFMLMVIPFVLILREPDLGTALLFPLTLYAMLVAAGARLRHLFTIALVVALAAPGAYPFLTKYQQKRVRDFILPWVGMNDPPLQIVRSRIAVGAGGLTGQGAEGARYIGRVSEANTDFIFAVVGLQRGFVGCGLILLFYMAFFAASVEIAGSTKDQFGRLMVVGLSSMILFQAMINIGMTIALCPVVGIALPFVSYGGSSLLISMMAAGLLLNVSVRRQMHSVASMQYASV